MKIKEIKTKHFRIPLRSAMTDSTHGEMTHFEVIMVLIDTHDGTRGTGYTYTIGQGGAAIKSLIDEAYQPLLLGENPRNIERHWENMWWRLHYIGRGGLVSFAISAVDIALWDLVAKKDGLPLWQLLGGSARKVKPYAGGIDLHLDIDGLLAQTQKNLDQAAFASCSTERILP